MRGVVLRRVEDHDRLLGMPEQRERLADDGGERRRGMASLGCHRPRGRFECDNERDEQDEWKWRHAHQTRGARLLPQCTGGELSMIEW